MTRPDSISAVLKTQTRACFRARILVHGFYVATGLALVLRHTVSDATWGDFNPETPLWPVAWMRLFPPDHNALVVGAGIGLALGSALSPHRRILRFAAAVAVGISAALENSLGKITHHDHLWFWVSVVFVLLPAGPPGDRSYRQAFLNTVWAATALVLCVYALSGAWKVLAALHQWALGEMSLFHPQSMAIHTASHLLTEARDPWLARWWIAHPQVSWLAAWIHVGFSLTAPLTLRRPCLVPVWGVYFVLFHGFTWLTMDILFPSQVGIVLLLLVASPFGLRSGGRAGIPSGDGMGAALRPFQNATAGEVT